MRLRPLLLGVLVVGCAPAVPSIDGGVDAGPAHAADAGGDAGLDSGVVPDGGTDAGVPDFHQIDSRSCFNARWGSPVGWDLDAGVPAGWDAGGPSPCLPLPPLGLAVTVVPSQEGGWFVPAQVSWAEDAGCRLSVDSVYASSNGTHAIHLWLDATDAGLLGGGTYSVRGASSCEVPLDAVGTPTGP